MLGSAYRVRLFGYRRQGEETLSGQEQPPSKRQVAGSSPAGRAKFRLALPQSPL